MLDFSVVLAADGNVIDFRIVPAYGRIESRMTYDGADLMLSGQATGADERLRILAMPKPSACGAYAGAVMLERTSTTSRSSMAWCRSARSVRVAVKAHGS